MANDQTDRPCARGDIEEIKAWAASEEGVKQIIGVLEWARKKAIALEKAERVTPIMQIRRVTR